MLGALTFLFIVSLLQGGLSGEFSINVPPNMEVVKGSCVTIPCSLDVPKKHEQGLNSECRAIWIKKDSDPWITLLQAVTGDLTKKDCTSTFNNMDTKYSSQYYFRLECSPPLLYTFSQSLRFFVNLVVTDDPPAPSLTPSHLEVKEGSSVNLTCSAPAPCQTHPPTLTWTPSLGDVQEELQEDEDKTKVKMSVLTFTASHLHHGKIISCTVIYKIQDGSEDASVSRNLTIAVSYSPKDTTVSVRPSGPVQQGSHVTLTCTSNANPAVKNFTWYRDDGSQKTVIGTKVVLNIQASEVSRPFFCEAANDVGVGRSNLIQIDVQYSPKNTTVSVRPSGPVQQGSHVTLTCTSNANPAIKNFTWYKVDGSQKTVVGTEIVLNIQASEVSRPFFCEAANDVGVGRSNLIQIDVQFPPRILLSSDCTKTTDQIKCSCETVGNPFPTLYWSLDGRPVSQSDKFVISSERLNDGKGLRSFITVNEPQEMNCFTLMCHSFNSLGFASQQFHLEHQSCAESHVQMLLPLFITTTVTLLALVCALLCVIRTLKNRQNPHSHVTGESSRVATSQHLIGEANEVHNTTEEGIYANTASLRQPHTAGIPTVSESNGTRMPSSGPNSAEGVGKSSEKNEEESNVIYSMVSWKSKNKQGADSANTNPSGGSHLEEKSMVGGVRGNFMRNALEMGNLYDEVGPRNVKKETECEYAQVKFKGKSSSKK